MGFKIFYSWQSKKDKKFCMFFIQDCLKEAVKRLNKTLDIDEPDFIIDRDTKDVPGYPNIPTTIEGKISDCDIFIGDLTLIGIIDNEGIINQNVNNELGFALGSIGSERIITVMNTAYGDPSLFPFDLTQRRNPIQYNFTDSNEENKSKIKANFVNELYNALKLVFTTELERRKKEYHPFDTYKTWDEVFPKNFEFENNDYFDQLFTEIRQHIVDKKTIYRLIGLAGLGKTRLLLECFRKRGNDIICADITNRVLYVNLNENEEIKITETIKNLIRSKSNKIIIIDNCSASYHYSISKIIRIDHSKLSLITIGIDPDERIDKSDPDGFTKLIVLDSLQCKDIIRKILKRNFKEFLDDEIELLVEFSNGLAVIAAIMGNNKERGIHQPGSLQEKDLLERLLGELYTDLEQRKVLLACSLFSRFGFYDDLSYQIETIATSPDLCNLNLDGVHEDDIKEFRLNRVKSVCIRMYQRQLLEKVGRTFAFRPTPLAVKMAEEWWEDCTTSKFNRLIPILKEGDLIEKFCEQFQYLKHLEQARKIVENLCNGVFSSAEVLNTEEGSRIFRSFVIVNPQACVLALQSAFSRLTTEEIKEIKVGRRNLVWALEKLCFRNETFIESAKILALFAAGENENIGNNATAQFLQLFHIYLPATSASYEDRWNIIQMLFNKGDKIYTDLGLDAISNALKAHGFNRMGGSEDQGDLHPLRDYQPSNMKEIHNYWGNVIGRLNDFVFQKGLFQEKAIEIVKSKFAQLSLKGGSQILWDTYKQLIENGKIERFDARESILKLLNSKDAWINYPFRKELEIYLQLLQPKDFLDLFQTFIVKPTTEDYYNKDFELNGEKLGKKVSEVALYFSQMSDQWGDLTHLLTSGNLSEGYKFGLCLGRLLKEDIIKSFLFVDNYISGIKNLDLEKINLSVLLGFITGSDNDVLKKSLFEIFIEDEKLHTISFTIASRIELPFNCIIRLFDVINARKIDPLIFMQFKYGWGIKHLNKDEALGVVQKIYDININGSTAAFLILATWCYDNEKWEIGRSLFKKMLIEKGDLIASNIQDSMDFHYWTEVMIKLLGENIDNDLAEKCIHVIFSQTNELNGYYSRKGEFYRLLDIIQESYFQILWAHLTKLFDSKNGNWLLSYQLKDLLGSHHDYYNFDEGLLFKGNIKKFETILDWCKSNQDERLDTIAGLIPIFKKDEFNKIWTLHHYTERFIDEFGIHQNVLRAIGAHMGTYSWTGSVVPFLRMKESVFEKLITHIFPNVKEWAKRELDYVKEQIKKETNQDEEWFL